MTAKDGEPEVSKKRKIRLETMRVDRLPMWTPGLPDVCPCTMPEASKSPEHGTRTQGRVGILG